MHVSPESSPRDLPPAQSPDALTAPSGLGPSAQITHGPSFAMLRVDLGPGQRVTAEAGAMVARHKDVAMEVKLNAPRSKGPWGLISAVLVAIIRKLVGGETFFVSEFTAPAGGGGSVWLAPTMAGQIQHRRLRGESLVLSAGAFLAYAGDVELGLRFGGLRGLFAREGFFFLEARGTGDLWFNSYGGIEAVDVEGSYLVDNGHLVGFEGPLTFDIRTAGGGLLGLFASGEGLVCEFKGRGRVYLQSRNPQTLHAWLASLM